MSDEHRDADRPAYGPSGYLPERASKRARKIVLRAPLGIQWVIASLVAGLVVVVAGILFLRSASGPPDAPYQRVAEVGELATFEVVTVEGAPVAVLGGRAFVPPEEGRLRYCPDDNRLVAGDRVFLPTGRGVGNPSLRRYPSVVRDEVLYVDVTTSVEGPDPLEDRAGPVDC